MSAVIYPGSFDPITRGHIDIICRAANLFDKVIVCVLNNSTKKSSLFSLDNRVNMVKNALADEASGDIFNFDINKIEVASDDGLLIDFAKKNDVNIIIRGLREVTDFTIELQMAQANNTMAPEIETLFMPTNPKLSYLSSSMVKEFASYGKSVSAFVSPSVEEEIIKKYSQNYSK